VNAKAMKRASLPDSGNPFWVDEVAADQPSRHSLGRAYSLVLAIAAAGGDTRRAMSQEANVEALRPVYEEWGRGNWSPRFEVYAADFEWGWSEEFPGGLQRPSRDPALKSDRLREWLSPWQDWRCEAEDFLASGEFVVVLCRYTGRGKESGVAVDSQGAHLWTMRDGQAIRLEVFSTRRRALDAAGLSE
jgi:uncharacterized protein